MYRKSVVLGATLLLLAGLAPFENTTAAVEIRGSGTGGALIVPLWSIGVGANSADGSTDTLFTLTNHANQPTAVKVRIIGQSGAEVAAFNIYLDGWDSFAAALFADAQTDGQGTLITRDASCLIPGFDADADNDSDPRRLRLAGMDVGGYIEVIDMGQADPESGLTRPGESPSNNPIRWLDCETLQSRFEDGWQVNPAAGLLPPAEALSARVQLIDVAAGANAAFAAIAISGFSDIVQHSPPDAATPNLATAHTADTDAGTTVSRLCMPDECREFEWDRPIDAVASVLTTLYLKGDINAKSTIGAESEMVLISPLARYADEYPPAAVAAPMLSLRTRDGDLIWLPGSTPTRTVRSANSGFETPRLSPPLPRPSPVSLPVMGAGDTVQVIPFAVGPPVDGDPPPSRLLGMPVATSVALGGDEGFSARAEVWLRSPDDQRLVSRDGYVIGGLPLIGLIVRQFTNGTLIDPDSPGQPVLANYRGPERMSARRQFWPVQL